MGKTKSIIKVEDFIKLDKRLKESFKDSNVYKFWKHI